MECKMQFLDWLEEFSGDESYFMFNSVNLENALKCRYFLLRNIKKSEDFYPFTDYKKVEIEPSEAIVYADKVFDRAREDYKDVSLLKNSSSKSNGSIYGWFYREYKDVKPAEVKERLSMNIYGAKGIFNKLDDILSKDKGQHIQQYKVPADYWNWVGRHDPMTVYFSSLTPELLTEIVGALKSYLRQEKAKEILNVENPYGVKLPSGIYYNKECSKADIQHRFDNIAKYFPEFEIEARRAFDKNNSNVLSVGQMYVLQKFQAEFKRDVKKIDRQSVLDYIKSNRSAVFDKGSEMLNKSLESDIQKLDAFYSVYGR